MPILGKENFETVYKKDEKKALKVVSISNDDEHDLRRFIIEREEGLLKLHR